MSDLVVNPSPLLELASNVLDRVNIVWDDIYSQCHHENEPPYSWFLSGNDNNLKNYLQPKFITTLLRKVIRAMAVYLNNSNQLDQNDTFLFYYHTFKRQDYTQYPMYRFQLLASKIIIEMRGINDVLAPLLATGFNFKSQQIFYRHHPHFNLVTTILMIISTSVRIMRSMRSMRSVMILNQ